MAKGGSFFRLTSLLDHRWVRCKGDIPSGVPQAVLSMLSVVFVSVRDQAGAGLVIFANINKCSKTVINIHKYINEKYYLRGTTEVCQKIITKTQYQSQNMLVYMCQTDVTHTEQI